MSPPPITAGHALVIGASRGLGLALARHYAAAGVKLTATARDEAGLAALRALGAQAIRLDVTQPASAAGLAWQLDGAGFDRVIVNAGAFGPRLRTLDAPTVADFDAVMHTNVLGPMQVLPQLLDALAPGAKLMLLSSVLGSIGRRSSAGPWLYGASKAALNSVAKDLALALAGRAAVIAVHPGWVRTDMGGPAAPLSPEASAADLCALLERIGPADSGGFFNHDGAPLPW